MENRCYNRRCDNKLGEFSPSVPAFNSREVMLIRRQGFKIPHGPCAGFLQLVKHGLGIFFLRESPHSSHVRFFGLPSVQVRSHFFGWQRLMPLYGTPEVKKMQARGFSLAGVPHSMGFLVSAFSSRELLMFGWWG